MKIVNFIIDSKYGILFQEEFEFPDNMKDEDINREYNEWYESNINDHADGIWNEIENN